MSNKVEELTPTGQYGPISPGVVRGMLKDLTDKIIEVEKRVDTAMGSFAAELSRNTAAIIEFRAAISELKRNDGSFRAELDSVPDLSRELAVNAVAQLKSELQSKELALAVQRDADRRRNLNEFVRAVILLVVGGLLARYGLK